MAQRRSRLQMTGALWLFITVTLTITVVQELIGVVVAEDDGHNNQDWQLLWSDEFDGGVDENGESSTDPTTIATRPNNSFWNTEVGFLGFNAEFQTYTDHLDNVYLQNGKLHLAAQKDSSVQVGYTSGRINTQDKVQVKYVMIEAAIKIPDMKMGLWPAFWTLGQNYPQVGWPAAGEIDIMELGQKQGGSLGLGNRRVVSAFHWDAYKEYVQENGLLDLPYDLSQDFHIYRLEWQPDYLATYVDGYLVYRMKIDYCVTHFDCAEFHQFHYMILNLAVAGLFACCEYGFELNDFPDGTTWTMEVDYVRVFGNEHTELLVANVIKTTTTSAPTSQPSVAPLSSSGVETSSKNTTNVTLPTESPITVLPTPVPQEEQPPTTAPSLSTQSPTIIPSLMFLSTVIPPTLLPTNNALSSQQTPAVSSITTTAPSESLFEEQLLTTAPSSQQNISNIGPLSTAPSSFAAATDGIPETGGVAKNKTKQSPTASPTTEATDTTVSIEERDTGEDGDAEDQDSLWVLGQESRASSFGPATTATTTSRRKRQGAGQLLQSTMTSPSSLMGVFVWWLGFYM